MGAIFARHRDGWTYLMYSQRSLSAAREIEDQAQRYPTKRRAALKATLEIDKATLKTDKATLKIGKFTLKIDKATLMIDQCAVLVLTSVCIPT